MPPKTKKKGQKDIKDPAKLKVSSFIIKFMLLGFGKQSFHE
jgi:hypothetical protein